MSNFSVDELARRDFLTCLGVWFVLEVTCFLLLPRIGLINPGARLRPWFVASLPLGIGGALLSAASSRFLAVANERHTGSRKSSRSMVGQLMGAVGLIGITLPLIMAIYEFFANVAAGIQTSS